jgi:hypothetical protein
MDFILAEPRGCQRVLFRNLHKVNFVTHDDFLDLAAHRNCRRYARMSEVFWGNRDLPESWAAVPNWSAGPEIAMPLCVEAGRALELLDQRPDVLDAPRACARPSLTGAGKRPMLLLGTSWIARQDMSRKTVGRRTNPEAGRLSFSDRNGMAISLLWMAEI